MDGGRQTSGFEAAATGQDKFPCSTRYAKQSAALGCTLNPIREWRDRSIC